MKKTGLNILFFVFVALLLFHLLLSPLKFITDTELKGYFVNPPKPEFRIDSLLKGSFQQQEEAYAKSKFGLRPALVRLHNELEFDLFDNVHAEDCRKGKNGYLFAYKDYFYDPCYPDTARIERYANDFKVFADSMKKKNVNVMWVIAPEKNYVYPEFLPKAELYGPNAEVANYLAFKRIVGKKGFPFIDFNTLAMKEKKRFPFPVMTKTGKHWTRAYAARCYDSLLHFMDVKFNYENNSSFYFSGPKAWDDDYDLERTCNLLFKLERNNTYDGGVKTNPKKKLKILLVGDSFCYAWVWSGWFWDSVDQNTEFWYYNRERSSYLKTFPELPQDKKKFVEQFDCIVVAYSALNLAPLDWGFIESLK